MEDNGERITSILLKKKTRKRLMGLGKKGETYDEILNKLMDHKLNPKQKEEK